MDRLDRRSATSSLAFVIDGLFRGASFCKYLCPIGQFNFVQSLVSPLEVKVRDPDVCQSCRTQGLHPGHATGLPGCELDLYLPRKSGNLDCTFCLDCVHACPHENVGILAVLPGRDLWNDAHHSGIGRFGDRPDLAALDRASWSSARSPTPRGWSPRSSTGKTAYSAGGTVRLRCW